MISAHFEKGRCYFGTFNKDNDTNPKTGQGGVSFFRFKAIGFLLNKLGLAYKVDYQDGAKHGIVYIKPDSFKHWLERHEIKDDKALKGKQIEGLIQQVCKERPSSPEKMEKEVKEVVIPSPELTSKGTFVALGNSKLEDAEVFCLTEGHGNENDAKRNGEIINKYYRPGDLIYIEGVEVGKSSEAGRYYMTRFVNPNYPVQGWEPANFREFNPHLSEWSEMADKLTNFLHLSNNPKDEDLKSIIDKYREIAKYVGMDEKKINFGVQFMESNAKEEPVLKHIITTLSENLEKLLDNKQLSLLKGKTISSDAIIKRNDSICGLLSQNKDRNIRKFYIMGTAHPLDISGSSTSKKLQSELAKHPFVICVDRNHFEKANIGKRNPNLKEQSVQ